MTPARATPEPADARARVAAWLDQAAARAASDLHLEPTASGYRVRFRVDGELVDGPAAPREDGRAAVNRLMVLAELLTYRTDVPQEGRFSAAIPSLGRAVELRLSVMPTTHGLRASIRLPAELHQPRELAELGLPPAVLAGLDRFARAATGMLLLTGPAGSGKTTTIYAWLEALARREPGLSLVSLEDPVERDLPGVTQIEVTPFGELTYARALRSMLRQDPQVLALGEIRDAETAQLACQAAMTGHRLVSTLHAGTPGGAVVRLLEMGVEPYRLTSSLFGIVSVRLLRRLASGAGRPSGPAPDARYAGRVPVAAFAPAAGPLREAILARADAGAMDRLLAQEPGYQTLHAAAARCIAQGLTDPAEADRVLGPDPAAENDDAQSRFP